jgi:hypothetical protein
VILGPDDVFDRQLPEPMGGEIADQCAADTVNAEPDELFRLEFVVAALLAP